MSSAEPAAVERAGRLPHASRMGPPNGAADRMEPGRAPYGRYMSKTERAVLRGVAKEQVAVPIQEGQDRIYFAKGDTGEPGAVYERTDEVVLVDGEPAIVFVPVDSSIDVD